MPVMPYIKFRSFLADGTPNAGGYVHTFLNGTTTPYATWSDADLTQPNTNPVHLDAAGEAWIFTNYVPLTVDVKDANGISLSGWPKDNVIPESADATGVLTSLAGTGAGEGDALWTFKQTSGSGGVARTGHSKFTDFAVTPYDYGAVGGTTDDTAAIQAAINSGKDVDFCGGTFMCSGLTIANVGQTLFSSSGRAELTKNGDGAIITINAQSVVLRNLHISGTGYTGDNISILAGADYCILDQCTSRYASGRAVKCLAGQLKIFGSNTVYETTDATATGYDIEIGSLGTTTYYHVIDGINTNQATGGILLYDNGTSVVCNSEFGKLTVTSTTPTPPAGVGGTRVIGCRIKGAISIGTASTTFSSCQIATVAVDISAGDASRIDSSNVFENGSTLTYSGTASGNNFTERVYTTVSGYSITMKLGPDTSSSLWSTDYSTGKFRFPGVEFANNALGVRFKATSGSEGGGAYYDSNDQFNLTQNTANKGIIHTIATGGYLQVYIGATRMYVDASGIHLGDSSAPVIMSGAGSPEGAFTRPKGSIYTNTSGSAGTRIYWKSTSSGNTGWEAVL